MVQLCGYTKFWFKPWSSMTDLFVPSTILSRRFPAQPLSSHDKSRDCNLVKKTQNIGLINGLIEYRTSLHFICYCIYHWIYLSFGIFTFDEFRYTEKAYLHSFPVLELRRHFANSNLNQPLSLGVDLFSHTSITQVLSDQWPLWHWSDSRVSIEVYLL